MKNKLSKAAVAGILFGALLLTGCTQAPSAPLEPTQGVSNTQAPTIAPSEPASPSESTTAPLDEAAQAEQDKKEAAELAKKLESAPLGIDIKESLANYSTPEVAEFAKEHNVAEGIRTGLSFYQDLIYTSDFYSMRDSSKDFDLINVDKFADRMDYDLLARIETSIKKDAQFGYIPVANGKSELVYDLKDGKPVSVKLAKNDSSLPNIPTNVFNTPAVSAEVINETSGVRITGKQTITLQDISGKVAGRLQSR